MSWSEECTYVEDVIIVSKRETVNSMRRRVNISKILDHSYFTRTHSLLRNATAHTQSHTPRKPETHITNQTHTNTLHGLDANEAASICAACTCTGSVSSLINSVTARRMEVARCLCPHCRYCCASSSKVAGEREGSLTRAH